MAARHTSSQRHRAFDLGPYPNQSLPMRRGSLILAIIAVLLIVAIAAYVALVPGLSSARQKPGALEIEVATYLLHHSVPDSAINRANPLGVHPDPAALREGQDLFAKNCEACHAHDGRGQTQLGANVFPRPPNLSV